MFTSYGLFHLNTCKLTKSMSLYVVDLLIASSRFKGYNNVRMFDSRLLYSINVKKTKFINNGYRRRSCTSKTAKIHRFVIFVSVGQSNRTEYLSKSTIKWDVFYLSKSKSTQK